MGTDGRGAMSLAAMKFGSTWGTAVECGANDGFRIRSSGLTGGKEILPDESLAGGGYGNAPTVGQEMHEGAPPLDFRYGGRCSQILAAIMGSAGAPTTVEATYEYTHLLSFESRLGDFVTYCLRKGNVAVWEYASAKFTRLVIEISGRGPGSMNPAMIAGICTKDDSGTNTLATFANVTVRSPLAPVFLGDCRFRMNAQGGAALDSGDVLKPNLIRLTVDRNLSRDFLADQTLGRSVSEPVEQGEVGVYLQIGFAEYTAETYKTLVEAGTEKKADLLITSSAAPLTGAASGLYHQYDFDFPRLVPWEGPENEVTGPDRIEDGITFRCLEASAAPTGMTATVPFECLVRNQISSNLLA